MSQNPEYLNHDTRSIAAILAKSEEDLVMGDKNSAEHILCDIPQRSINQAVGELSFHAALAEDMGATKEFFADLRMLERLAILRERKEYPEIHESFNLWNAKEDDIVQYWETLGQTRELFGKSQRLFRRAMTGTDAYGISALLTLAVSYESVLMARNEILREKEMGMELEIHRSLIDALGKQWVLKTNRGKPPPYGQ